MLASSHLNQIRSNNYSSTHEMSKINVPMDMKGARLKQLPKKDDLKVTKPEKNQLFL